MKVRSTLLSAVTVVLLTVHPAALAGSAGAQPATSARKAMIPLRSLEQRIVPQMRGFTYLGAELDSKAQRYRLKFLRGKAIAWIDVDAVTGEIIGKNF